MHRDSEKIWGNSGALHQSGILATRLTPARVHACDAEKRHAPATVKTRRCETVMLQ